MYNSINLGSIEGNFSFDELADGLKTKKFNNICFITGAGISVASGIPDFRSDGGLYHTLAKKHNVSTPEELMTLNFFQR